MHRFLALLSLFALSTSTANQNTSLLAQQIPIVAAESIGFEPRRLERIDPLIERAIADQKMPGCVVCFGRQGKVAYLRAFGNKQVEPETVAMTTDTVFDLASLTKPVATSTAIMKLIENGDMRLKDRIVQWIPEFASDSGAKKEMTVKDLLIHQSGLIPDNAMADYENGPESAWAKIYALEPQFATGEKFQYSDVNFLLLGKIVERVAQKPLDQFLQEEFWTPLKMQSTGFCIPRELQQRCAPTQKRNDQWIVGEVHDPRAYALGGVAGHAGLFSTAEDLAIYANMMLSLTRHDRSPSFDDPDSTLLAERTVDLMTRSYSIGSVQRGLGWDKQSPYSSNRGDLLSERAFGHGGFTGTVLWIDPELDLFFIFLSNRVHPNGNGDVNPLAGRILNVIAAALKQP